MSDDIRRVDQMVDVWLDNLRGNKRKKAGNDTVRGRAYYEPGNRNVATVQVYLSTSNNQAFVEAFRRKLSGLGGIEYYCGPREIREHEAWPFQDLMPSEWCVWFGRIPL